jgi:ribokinase
MRILAIGDAMLDVIVKIDTEINFNSDTRSSISTHGGGAGANTASWLATLGVDSHFFGSLGNDSAGRLFAEELSALGVVNCAATCRDLPTGTVVVLVEGNGNRTMFPDPGANSKVSAELLPDPANFDAIFLSGYSLFNRSNFAAVTQIIDQIESKQIPILFDPASVGTMKEFGREEALALLPRFEMISLNEEEAAFLSGVSNRQGALENLLDLCPVVAIKLGPDGAIAGERGGLRTESKAQPVQAIDTTGAGDAFNAGFLAEFVNSKDLANAVRSGIQSASQCVGIIGARPRVGA